MRRSVFCLLAAVFCLGATVWVTGCASEGEDRYTICAEYFPQERLLRADMTVSVRNRTSDALSALSFSIYPNAYREGAEYRPVALVYMPSAYYAGKSYGGIRITALSGAESWTIAGEDENILSVSLSRSLSPGEKAQFSLSFEVTLAQVNHRLGAGEHVVTLADFYPVLCPVGEDGFSEYVCADLGDPFVRECADYEVSLTVPSEYLAVCGFPAEIEEGEAKTTYRIVAKKARDVAFVLGKELECVSAEQDGTQVEFWYFDCADPETALAAAQESLACFSELFGNYGGRRYALVQADLPYGGMEYTGLSMLSPDLTKKELAPVIAHETAHQWWYASVGSNQFEAPWQDEGLAEYSAALFLERNPQYGTSYSEFVSRCEKSYRAYYSVSSQLSGMNDTSMTRALTSFRGEYEYRNISYEKGVILFDRVRQVVGDKRFFEGLREYASGYAGKLASCEDLIACFRKAGPGAEGIFRSFIQGDCVI